LGFWKKTVRDIDLSGKSILMRADYNVPVSNGKITDDYRLKQSLPTIRYLLDKKCKIVITSHMGRPKNKPEDRFSLEPVSKKLSKLLEKDVKFERDCIGKSVKSASSSLKKGEILLLENVRFHPEEEENDKDFAKAMAKDSSADIFVQDGFGAVHRAHASIEAITHFLPSVSGLLLEKEVNAITEVIDSPKRPLMAIIGGAKISGKIDVIKRFIDIADFVAVGGAMANTFLLAKDINIGKSMAEADEVDLAHEILEKAEAKAKDKPFAFYIPQDGVVAKSMESNAKTRIVDWDAHVISSIESYPKTAPRGSGEVAEDESILDIGPFSGAFIAGGMQLASTVVWNGAMGVTEIPSLNGPIGPFSHGTELVVEAILGEFGNKPHSLVGGGDTVGFLAERKIIDKFNHVSTGGGASLELMSGKVLPGVQALQDKE